MKYLLMIFTVFTLVSCTHQNYQPDCNTAGTDPDGYLKKICSHIVENKLDVNPGKADKYEIREISEIEKNGKKLIMVQLNCCYLGETALFDPDTNEIVSFLLGPK